MVRFIFVTGGVVSSLGKGIASASIATLLQSRGYKIRIRKLDPYLNIDPGTMNPYEHGEVYVTEDGAETDLDLGHYERFTGINSKKSDNITTGKIYQNIITKERNGGYKGATVQIIPHVTDEIKKFITSNLTNEDFVICEIGGTVGDIESLPFLEAIRQYSNESRSKNCLFIHLTLVPYIKSAAELKTKPTQHSVKELRSIGIQPDMILCRSESLIPSDEKAKIALFCNVDKSNVFQSIDVKSIYEVPIKYQEEGLDKKILDHFGIVSKKIANLENWKKFNKKLISKKDIVKISIVGKYTHLKDSYKSLNEALIHASVYSNVNLDLNWIESSDIKNLKDLEYKLKDSNGILIPGGFGRRGVEGKILSIYFARTKKIPFFGICFGMQISIIEAARNLLGLKNSNSTELSNTKNPVVCLIDQWTKRNKILKGEKFKIGGSMRLGSYPAKIKKNSLLYKIYGKKTLIHERHRHRYEVNTAYKAMLEKKGVVFSANSPDGKLPEAIELKDHPWFLGVQFHPELKSRPFEPHKIFVSFIEAAIKNKNLNS
jgi:CTP synthase